MIARIRTVCFVALVLLRAALAQEPAAETVRLTGRVLRGDGQPVAGAALAFAPADAQTTAQLLAEQPLRSGADGRFELRVPARYSSDELAPPVLLVAAKGFAAVAPSIPWKSPPAVAAGEVPPRLDTDVGDIVLPEGARLFGRVRDAAGNGLGGVVVTARDLLEGSNALPGTPSRASCRAVSAASGIFELPAALPRGAVLDFAASGHYRQTLFGVAVGTPLEVELVPAGQVVGRVVDRSGAPVVGALVGASYERSGSSQRVASGADGMFRLPIEQPGRFRVHAARPRTAGNRRGADRTESDVQQGPIANLELTLPSANAAPVVDKNLSLRVQAVEAASGKPIAAFRATAIWTPFALQNAAYLDHIANTQLASATPAAGGEVTVTGPREQEGRTGAVAVSAPGFATAIERDIEWAEGDAEAERKPVVVKLVPASTLRGRVIDDTTGAPIAGARVWVARKFDPSQGSFRTIDPESAVRTAADGSFELGELGPGDWSVSCRHAERPQPPAQDVTLMAEEHKVGFELKLPAGARVAGRITGMTLPAGCKALLQPIAVPRLGGSQYWSSHSSSEGALRAPIAADGAFQFVGVATKSYYLFVEQPSPPRCGEPIYLPIEPLRVTAAGVQRDFVGGDMQPGRVSGRIVFPQAVPAAAMPVVVAEPITDDPNQPIIHGGRNQFPGPRAFADAEGNFTLVLAPGKHRLRVVDSLTGLQMAEARDPVVLAPNGAASCEIAVPLTEVVVQLQPPVAGEAMPWLDRLEVRHVPPAKGVANVFMGGNSDEYDMGGGVPIPFGATSVRLWLAEGKVTLLARSGVARLQRKRSNSGGAPLVRDEFDLAANEKGPRTVALAITAVPEIEPKADGGDAKAAGKE